MKQSAVGLIGLGVMGANLAQNLEHQGFPCSVFNRRLEVLDKFLTDHPNRKFSGFGSYKDFVESLESPRKIFLMITAGASVDSVLNALIPFLSRGDIVMDGGNSYFRDTIRREELCRSQGIHFLGVGISGGEEGALNGASLMPGGPKEAFEAVAEILEKIAAYADGPCSAYMGPNGAGHFVKMVHNGIEYGDMQLIAEAYDLLRTLGGFKPPQLSEIFERWNSGVLSSFLIEITGKIFKKDDADSGGYLVDAILDKAGQKGTGRWTVEEALALGVAVPTIAASLDARNVSARKDSRVRLAEIYSHAKLGETTIKSEELVTLVRDALYAAKILSYAQGMELLQRASNEWNWDLKLHSVAAIWKGGCIIRARFLDEIRRAFSLNPSLENLLFDSSMREAISESINSLGRVVGLASSSRLALPAMSASLAYFNLYTTARLPLNLTQAQRDFFGAHTYERVDKEGTFHSQW